MQNVPFYDQIVRPVTIFVFKASNLIFLVTSITSYFYAICFLLYEQIVRPVAISVFKASNLTLLVTSITSYMYTKCSHFMNKLFAKWPYRCPEYPI